MRLAHVYMEHPTMKLDHTFTYRCDGFSLCRGMRVKVPFGIHDRAVVAFVDQVEEVEESTYCAKLDYQLKSVLEQLDKEPLINEELFALAGFMAQTCIAPMIACFQCMLPSKLKPKSSMRRLKTCAWVVVDHPLCEGEGTKRQREIWEIMLQRGEMRRSDFYREFKTAGKKLIEIGALRIEEREEVGQALYSDELPTAPLHLRDAQVQAIERIEKAQDSKTFLLHGVTGSGKSEVFLQLAQRVLDRGKQVLILVPEIALTPQMMERVAARFQGKAAIYHSALNAQEKYEQYMLVKRHQVAVVVGTRSAIFMPFDDLGLIVMDEEHDLSYKQDSAPRYHCRDIAIERAKTHHCPLVLASATPSLESYARAVKGVYELIEMPQRINEQFPSVQIVEMKQALANRESYLLSDVLIQAIEDRLSRGEQMILLLNRRGYTPILRCIDCGHVVQCPHCDLAMNYHKDEQVLKCHTCNHTMKLPHHCPNCNGSAWRYLGMGTQRLEEFVSQRFAQARILRMDADTTGRKHAHAHLLERFRNHEADILLGTQMIAKGLDFPDVTLVGILNGDALLHHSDYRCGELTYDLLEQASGRSGRHDKAGTVIIQAYDTNHYAIQCAAKHDYRSFFVQEMRYRHLALYPPYAYLASIVLRHKQEDEAMKWAAFYVQRLKEHDKIKVLGPAALGKSKDEYRVRILCKGKDQYQLNLLIWEIYRHHLKAHAKAVMEVDLQPLMLE